MTSNKNIIIPLDEKPQFVLSEIIKKYNLEENEKQAFEKVTEHKLFNENILIKLVRELMLEKISNQQFLDTLHTELKTSEAVTKNIAKDIADNLIPILEKIPEDKLQEYNRKKSLEERKNDPVEDLGEDDEQAKKEAFAKAKEELFKKIGVGKPKIEEQLEENLPGGERKPEVKNVEDNAKGIQHGQERPVIKEQGEGKKEEEKLEPPKPADPYKESIE